MIVVATIAACQESDSEPTVGATATNTTSDATSGATSGTTAGTTGGADTDPTGVTTTGASTSLGTDADPTTGTTTGFETTSGACDGPDADPEVCSTSSGTTTSDDPEPLGGWWRQVGGPELDTVQDIAVAADGDVIVSGAFRGMVDFGGGPVSAALLEDAFIARYAPDGQLRWVRHFGSTASNSDNALATGVAVDAAGNVLATGTFEGMIDPGTGALVSAGKHDVFVVRLAADGAPLWGRRIGGGGFDRVRRIAVDAGGDALLAGTHAGKLFVAKLGSAGGDEVWSHELGAVGNGATDLPPVNDVATDAAGDLYLVGSFDGKAALGGDVLASAGGTDVFLARYRGSDGAHVWSRRHGGPAIPVTGGDDARGLVIAGDSLVICGGGWGPVDLGGGVLDAPESAHAAFLARYATADGAHVWSQRLDATSAERVALSGESLWALGLTIQGGRTQVELGRFGLADGAAQDSVPVPAPGELALGPDGAASLALRFSATITAGEQMFMSAGASDILIGPFWAP